MTVHPLDKTIRIEELDAGKIAFEVQAAYGVDHEPGHLSQEKISGENLWKFRFVEQGDLP